MPTISTQTEKQYFEKRPAGRPKKPEDPDKVKKEPTPYNLFMKDKMAELKADPDTAELSPREKMALIGQLWKDFKLANPELAPKAKTPKTEIDSEGEVVVKKQMKCGNCSGFGHNKRTCKV